MVGCIIYIYYKEFFKYIYVLTLMTLRNTKNFEVVTDVLTSTHIADDKGSRPLTLHQCHGRDGRDMCDSHRRYTCNSGKSRGKLKTPSKHQTVEKLKSLGKTETP